MLATSANDVLFLVSWLTLSFHQWISTAASLYLAHALVANSSEAHSMSTLLDSYVRDQKLELGIVRMMRFDVACRIFM
jgi:hypothetical protein